jgi:CheY-like chemotaxis protein
LKVLVVDDHRDIVECLAVLLTSEGHDVSSAMSGQEALQLTSKSCPDVALIDISMPVMDGFELAPLLRQACPNVVVVAISGWAPEYRTERELACFDQYLVKPLKLATLLALLRIVNRT